MQHTVIVHRDDTKRYEAVSLTIPNCAGKGESRSEALTDLQHVLRDWLRSAEITTIDVDSPGVEPGTLLFSQEASSGSQGDSHNPWLRTAGMFKDDPVLDEMLQDIYALRDAEEREN